MIVAQLLFGKDPGGADLSPSGKLPVTFPYAGKGFLDGIRRGSSRACRAPTAYRK